MIASTNGRDPGAESQDEIRPSIPGHRFAKLSADGLAVSALVGLFGWVTHNLEIALIGILTAWVFAAGLAVRPSVLYAGITLMRPRRALPKGLVHSARMSAALVHLVGAGLFVIASDEGSPGTQALALALALSGIAVIGASFLIQRPEFSAGRTFYLTEVVPAAAGIALVVFGSLYLGLLTGRGESKEKWHRSAMKSDLRNLVYVQEAHHSEVGTYAAEIPGDFQFSNEVVNARLMVGGAGWMASVQHRKTTSECVVYVDMEPVEPAAEEGIPACTVSVATVGGIRAVDFVAVFLALVLTGLAAALAHVRGASALVSDEAFTAVN